MTDNLIPLFMQKLDPFSKNVFKPFTAAFFQPTHASFNILNCNVSPVLFCPQEVLDFPKKKYPHSHTFIMMFASVTQFYIRNNSFFMAKSL